MSGSLGARLRHQREARGISLGTIAEQSKIKASLLEALERDDVSRWPTGIFRRAYVRSYAGAIGLDADVAVREFLAAHPDPYQAEAASASEAEGSAPGSRPPTRIRMLLDTAVGAISRHRRSRSAAPPVSPDVPELLERVEPAAALSNESSTVNARAERAPALDITAVSRLCTAFGRVELADQVSPLLEEAATLLGALGIVVWLPDESASCLKPTLSHGYSRKVAARLPSVDQGADNPTARAFRSAVTVRVCDETTGALVVPLLGPVGCVGALAVELPRGFEQSPSVEAVAVIVAAMLAPLVDDDRPVPPSSRSPASVPAGLPRARERSRVTSASYRS